MYSNELISFLTDRIEIKTGIKIYDPYVPRNESEMTGMIQLFESETLEHFCGIIYTRNVTLIFFSDESTKSIINLRGKVDDVQKELFNIFNETTEHLRIIKVNKEDFKVNYDGITQQELKVIKIDFKVMYEKKI